ncbi:Tm-1-like ATP-binding domain-containing protein [Gimesia maris]|uniref:Tm-1-like ATP-binding domain-containing protein n=1 Tax=Gimesia maris TaxID=122 RepID=UPI0032EFBC8E
MPQTVYALATMDTKADELCFVADTIRRTRLEVTLVDLSTRGSSEQTNITAQSVAVSHPDGPDFLQAQTDRGQAVTAMSAALRVWFPDQVNTKEISGVLAIGGSRGTAILAPVFQALPIGFPKLIVSTVASGNTEPYVGHSDTTMMYSLFDVADLNSASRRILSNAAHAIAGMVTPSSEFTDDRPTLSMTMFDAAKSEHDDVLLLCHGGPIAMPDDAQYIFDRVPEIDGFYGASSMERLPTEIAETDQVRQFGDLRLANN